MASTEPTSCSQSQAGNKDFQNGMEEEPPRRQAHVYTGAGNCPRGEAGGSTGGQARGDASEGKSLTDLPVCQLPGSSVVVIPRS